MFLISLAISLPAGPNLAAIESTCLLKSSKLPTLVMSPIFSCLPVALKLPCNTPVTELSPTLNRAIALSTASSLAKAAAVRRIAFRSRSLTSLVACVWAAACAVDSFKASIWPLARASASALLSPAATLSPVI